MTIYTSDTNSSFPACIIHRVTLNTNRTSRGEVLTVPVPKLDDGVVLMPGSLSLIFDLAVSGHTNNYIMNVVARALFDRLIMKFAREIAQDTGDYDQFKLSEDLFLTENERVSMFREGIQPVDLSNIRYNAEEKKKSGVEKENKFNVVYQNKYRIPLDQKMLKDHIVFLLGALCDELLFKLRLAPVNDVLIGPQ